MGRSLRETENRPRAAQNQFGRKLMVAKDRDEAGKQVSVNLPGPDMMLGVWASWMDQVSASTRTSAGPGRSWWETTADNPALNHLSVILQHLLE